MHEEIATNQNEVELFFVEDSFSKFSVTNMAAPITCALCRTGIKDKKSYRRVESLVSLKIQLQYLNLISPTSILCCFCFNKINRLHKIDGDLKTKVSKLREEKSVLIGELKALPGFSESENVTTTPKSKPQKRGINTPTPRSCRQVKRQMTKTPLSRGKCWTMKTRFLIHAIISQHKPRYQTMILKSRYSYCILICILILYNKH